MKTKCENCQFFSTVSSTHDKSGDCSKWKKRVKRNDSCELFKPYEALYKGVLGSDKPWTWSPDNAPWPYRKRDKSE